MQRDYPSHQISSGSCLPFGRGTRHHFTKSCSGRRAALGFLRAGEFTTVSSTKDTLSVADVSIDSRDNPQMLAVLLRRRKTDLFGAGVHLYVGWTSDLLCPVTAVQQGIWPYIPLHWPALFV